MQCTGKWRLQFDTFYTCSLVIICKAYVLFFSGYESWSCIMNLMEINITISIYLWPSYCLLHTPHLCRWVVSRHADSFKVSHLSGMLSVFSHCRDETSIYQRWFRLWCNTRCMNFNLWFIYFLLATPSLSSYKTLLLLSTGWLQKKHCLYISNCWSLPDLQHLLHHLHISCRVKSAGSLVTPFFSCCFYLH